MTEARLKELRNSIKKIDREIVRFLNQRAKIALEIGGIKAKTGLEVYDPSQESGIYENVMEANGGDLPSKSLRAIFREILSASRMLQSPVTVAYFGLEASFAHIAAQSHFGTSSQFFSHPTVASVFADVEKERVKWGVVPVENSLEGSVNLTLDRLITTTLHIRAEIFFRITHCLLSFHERMEDIKKVYSHPQALAQCQGWLRANIPNAALVEMESTAAAAQRVVKERNGAAIGSRAAAGIYGLDILSEGIEDKASNTTRFLVIGEGEGKATGKDKTSLLFATPHTPGALYNALQPFAERRINMMKIESYPVKDRLWEYLFFVDVAGHEKDEEIMQCLDNLRQRTTFLKILGSYPRSEDVQ
jgi:chorismate mutase/prephenate dehydratase